MGLTGMSKYQTWGRGTYPKAWKHNIAHPENCKHLRITAGEDEKLAVREQATAPGTPAEKVAGKQGNEEGAGYAVEHGLHP